MWSFRKVIRPVYANGRELLSGWFEIYNMLEKILKIKSLLKEDIDIDEEIKISCPGEMKIMTKNRYRFSWNFTRHTHDFAQ